MSPDNSPGRVYVNLVGGLGNQLFCLVFGLALSRKTGTELYLDSSLIKFGSNKTRKLEVQEFIFPNTDIKYCGSNLSNLSFLKNYEFSKRIYQKMFNTGRNTIKEEVFRENLRDISFKHFSGYFQSWVYADYLKHSNPEFSIELKTKGPGLATYEQDIKSNHPIFVHVRLGDYLIHNKVFSILPESYYLKAVKILIEQHPGTPVWLIVENLEEVKSYYPRLFQMADKIMHKKIGTKDSEIFYMMCKAKFLIASNSTFSLWPAWFVLNSGGRVIVPSEFKVNGRKSDLIDGRWDSIDLDSLNFKEKKSLDRLRSINYENYLNFFR